jgi:hypothetical protein
MLRNKYTVLTSLSLTLLSGCASVPMASSEQNTALKAFPSPAGNNAGLYVYRDTFAGQALKKTVSIDGSVIGETANKTFFYKQITPGQHTLSTESEFSDNSITFQAVSGKNYFAEQEIKMGVLVAGADVAMVSEDQGKKKVLECDLAK